MGNPVMDLARNALTAEGFAAVEAGPGSKAPEITGPVAALSIHSADWENLTVTVAVSILCPAALGAVRCQCEALRAGEILTRAGARCSQGKCTFDGLSRMYQVEVQAVFTGQLLDGKFVPGPGFSLTLEGNPLPYVVSFRAELSRQVQAQYEPGNPEPIALVSGEQCWTVALTELLPPGIGETEDSADVFTLTVDRCGVTEAYRNCRWREETREFTTQGLKQTRTGICTHREVTSHG